MEEFKDTDELYFYFQKCRKLKEDRSRTPPSVPEPAEEMERLAYYDALTNLKNRRAFEKDAEEMTVKGIPFWIISMDADNLKKVNDACGHQRGDELLKEIAASMEETFGKGNSYRFGGDEFAALLAGREEKEVSGLIKDFKDNLKKRRAAGFPASVSVGAAFCPDGGYQDKLEEADRKMYREKEKFKESLRKKTDTPEEKAMQHFSITYGMREMVMLYALAVLAAVLLN